MTPSERAEGLPDDEDVEAPTVSYFTIEFVTCDAGAEVRGGIDWLGRWAEKVAAEAPFAVDGLRIEAVARGETFDV